MLKLFKYLKPYFWWIVLILILTFIQVMANLQLPDYMAKIVDQGIVNKDNAYVWHTGLSMLWVALAAGVATMIVGYLAARVAAGFSRDVREKVFAKVESFSLVEFNKYSTASLITRSTNDIQQIQTIMVMILRMVISAPLMGIGAIIKAYDNSTSMTWIIALAVIVMLGIVSVLFSVALPKFKYLQGLVDKLNLVTRENLTGLRVIKAFNNQKFEEAKFEKVNVDLTNANLFVNRLMIIIQPVMMLIFNITAIAIVWVGAHLINDSNFLIGNMLAFMQYAMQVITSFLMISIIFIMLPRAAVSGQRVNEVLQTNLEISDPDKPQKIKEKGKGVVEFQDVTFTYPGADSSVLQNINFTALPRETTAIIGSTGSGKSTLISLIPRFYDVTKGAILIDGQDIRTLKMEDIYRKLGYIPQKGVLFSGTIKSNLKYGDPRASDEAVERAARIAQVWDFIEQSPEGLETPIAQGGGNVSGGQKQRLAIARAIVRNPEIYIFDDSFSALDFKTDSLLRAALRDEVKEKTVIIVAQRISTILDADKIIVLEDGKIVGVGKHSDLMKDCKVYQEIANSQLSEKELAQYQEAIDKEQESK
jgi:ATP-binding cassette subfamily B protein